MADESTTVGGKPGETAGSKVTTTLKGSMGERINKALLKVEEKKKKRAARRAQVCIQQTQYKCGQYPIWQLRIFRSGLHL